MLFELIIAPLHCEACEKNTEHIIKFIGYSSSTHMVKVEYYCQECFDLAAELDLVCDVYQKELLFDLYFALQEKYGDTKTP